MCLIYLIVARSKVTLATDLRVVNSVYFLKRGDVAFYAQGTQLDIGRWQQVGQIEVFLNWHQGDQERTGKIRVRTRYVVLMLELMS